MNIRKVLGAGVLVVGLGTAFQACGGGGSTPTSPGGGGTTPPPSGGGGGGTGNVITITSAGVSPKEITVSQGTRVQFVNNDTRNHDMNSDPHPTHGDCPAIDNVGFIVPGQTKETGNLNVVRTCGYHDHNLFPEPQWEGRIIVR